MIKQLIIGSASAFILTFGIQGASAATVAPELHSQAPATTNPIVDGGFKVAGKARRANPPGRRTNPPGRRANPPGRRTNPPGRRGNYGIGLGLGAVALGAAAAAAEDRHRSRRSCRRVERRCANRYGWETRRWFRCVEDRDC